ncbi:MAG: MBOAT family protein [Pseudomonadota bacterium]
MVFSSPVFLFIFFPITFAVYYLVKAISKRTNRFTNYWLLIASVVFYVWGAPKSIYLLLFAAGIVIDYLVAIAIGKDVKLGIPPSKRSKLLLAFAIALNLAFLAYYKYANFFVEELGHVSGDFLIQWRTIILPIGISFIAFHKISYLVDVYRLKAEPRRDLPEFMLYLLFFPQLIAGPIVRYHTISSQITSRTHSVDEVFEGIYRFAIGLGKKVLIANQLGFVVDRIFAQSPGTLDPTIAWLGILLYALQIYFDFSGYSDMAIGLGRMFGFRLPENFNRPYISKSITEFWRRWHMSLSSFFRDYLYIPLGGNQTSLQRTIFNLWIVFLLCGLWHGAKWTFVFWGAYYGLWLTLERLFLGNLLAKALPVFATLYTFVIVLIGWVLFRSPDLSYAFGYLSAMFDFAALSRPRMYDLALDYAVYPKVLICTLIAIVFSFTPDSIYSRLKLHGGYALIAKSVCGLLLIVYSISNLATGTFNPFLYFQF